LRDRIFASQACEDFWLFESLLFPYGRSHSH
jgi:hypothetical protein